MREWEEQHKKKESIITEGVQKVLDATSVKWDGVVRRAKIWNFTFAFLHTINFIVMAIVAYVFIEILVQMRADAVENQKLAYELQKAIKEQREYNLEKKKSDAADSEIWRKNMDKWSKR